MKNSLLRRSVSGVLAVAMVFSAYSCGDKKNNDNNEESSGTQAVQTANEVIKNSYSSIDMDIEIPADYIDSMYYIRDTSQVLIMGMNNEENKLYLTDMDFSGFNEISLDFPKPTNSQSYLRTTVSPDGYIYALLTLIDYGDFKLPDYKDPNFDYENFDFDAMNEAAEYSCILYKLSPDGQVVSENELQNINDYSSDSIYEGIYINNIVADANGNIIMSMSGMEEMYLIADENGRINGKISTGNDIHYVNSLTTDADGNIFACGYSNTGSGVFTIDMNSKTFKNVELDSEDNSDMNGLNYIYSGAGDYNFFFSTRTSLYGVDKNNKPVEIVNWINSDINPDSVRSVIALADGDFIAYMVDYENNTSGFSRLTKRSADELANQTVITVGMLYNDSSITSKITQFNKSNTDYRIKIADYSKYNEYDEEQEKMTNSAQKQLKMDIVSGNAPDMIITYDMSLISELAKSGVYTDLYPYLKDDEELSKDDIMPNVLKACEFGGKLYSLPSSFAIVSFACKTKFCDEENWTLDDMIDTFHENPDMEFSQYSNSKEAVFEMLAMSTDSFIDYDKLECHFDSDEFKKILEFANEFPDESEGINWETATDEEMQQYWNEQDTKCMNDKALLSNISFYEFTGYSQAKYVTFNDDITLVGIPSNDGKGGRITVNDSMAILDSSPSKDACWKFIKEFFKEEDKNQRYYYSHALPSLVSAFDKKAEESMSKPYWIDDDGNKIEYDNTYYINDREVTIPPLTKKEKDFVVDYIKNTDKIYRGYSDDVIEIVTEEVTKYFKGECSSQQAIDKIQSRVDIMINEQA